MNSFQEPPPSIAVEHFVETLQFVLVDEIDLDPSALALAVDADARAEPEPQLVFGGARVHVGLPVVPSPRFSVLLLDEGLDVADREVPGDDAPPEPQLRRFVGEREERAG